MPWMGGRNFRIGLSCFAAACLVKPVSAQELENGSRPAAELPDAYVDPQETIGDISLRGSTILVANLTMLESGEEVWLPLASLFTILGFEVEIDQNVYSGTFLSDEQHFAIDLEQRQADIAGHRHAIGVNDLVEVDGTAFISTTALHQWFRLNPTWNRRRLTLDFEPPYALPGERWQIRNQRGNAANRRADRDLDVSDFKYVTPPYAWLGWPTLTVNANLSHNRTGDNDFDGRLSLFAQSDFLRMQGNLALSGDLQGTTSARLTLGRDSNNGSLLGPLEASSFDVGDVVARSHRLVSRSVSGVGLQVTNRARRYQQVDERLLIGDAPPGWQVELRRGGAIIAFGEVSADGRYQFDVPLAVGNNRFAVHLFGPDGEERVIEREVDNRPLGAARGRLRYALSIIKKDTQLLEPLFGNNDRENTLATSPSAHWGPSGMHATLELDYGISRQLSLRTMGVMQSGGSGWSFYAGGGATARFESIDADGLVVISGNGNLAATGDLRGRVGRLGWQLSTEQFGPGFESDFNIQGANTLQSRNVIALDWRIDRWSLGLRGQTLRYSDQSNGWSISARASGTIGPVAVSQHVGVDRFGWNTNAYGSTIARSSLGGLRLRATIDYELGEAVIRPRSASFQASARLGRHFVQGGIERDFRLQDNRLLLRTSQNFGGVQLGSSVEYSDRRGFSAGLSLGLTIGRDPVSGTPFIGGGARLGQSSVRARFYHDIDGDQDHDPDEPWLPQGSLQTARGVSPTRADDGSVIFERLPGGRPVALIPDLTQMENPFYRTAEAGYLVDPRPGAIMKLDIPLQLTGQVSVRVTDSYGEGVGNVPVVLQPCEGRGRLVQITYSDGLAFFENVNLGCQLGSTTGAQDGQIMVDDQTPSVVTLVVVEPAD